MAQFYKTLGIELIPREVKKGSVTWRGLVGNLELQIYACKKIDPPPVPKISLRFEVANLSDILNKLRLIDGVQIVMDEMQLPDSKSAVVLDPDGHSVELSELWGAKDEFDQEKV